MAVCGCGWCETSDENGTEERTWPTVERKGLLPMATTRGDRLFIGLLGAAFIHLGWLGFTELPVAEGLEAKGGGG